MTDDPTTTGTPELEPQGGNGQEPTGTAGESQDGGNAAEVEQQNGDVTTDERAELDALRRQKGQWLAEKGTYEQTRRELEQVRSTSTPPTVQGGYDHNAAVMQQALQQKEAELHYRATQLGDADAAFQLTLLYQNRALAQEIHERTSILEVEAAERAEVQRTIAEARSRGEHITPATAKRLVQAERMAREHDQLAKQRQELDAQNAARARGVVSTRTVGVPRSELTKNEMTGEEFARRWDSLDEAGRDKLNADITSRRVVIIG